MCTSQQNWQPWIKPPCTRTGSSYLAQLPIFLVCFTNLLYLKTEEGSDLNRYCAQVQLNCTWSHILKCTRVRHPAITIVKQANVTACYESLRGRTPWRWRGGVPILPFLLLLPCFLISAFRSLSIASSVATSRGSSPSLFTAPTWAPCSIRYLKKNKDTFVR